MTLYVYWLLYGRRISDSITRQVADALSSKTYCGMVTKSEAYKMALRMCIDVQVGDLPDYPCFYDVRGIFK
jgi:hypothetical protein